MSRIEKEGDRSSAGVLGDTALGRGGSWGEDGNIIATLSNEGPRRHTVSRILPRGLRFMLKLVVRSFRGYERH